MLSQKLRTLVSVGVESEVGKGSTFTVKVPVTMYPFHR